MMKKNRITIQQLQVRNTLYLAAITTCFLLLLARLLYYAQPARRRSFVYGTEKDGG